MNLQKENAGRDKALEKVADFGASRIYSTRNNTHAVSRCHMSTDYEKSQNTIVTNIAARHVKYGTCPVKALKNGFGSTPPEV